MTTTTHPNVYDGTLLDEIIREQKLSRELVKKAASEILVIIKEGLLRDGVVRINHFGSFKLKRVAARKGRNPQTGEIITIPGRAKVIFTPCKALREMIEPVHARPVAAPAAATESVLAQKPETEVVHPEPVPEPAPLKTASQSDFAAVQPGHDEMDDDEAGDNKAGNYKAAVQVSENRKKNGQQKLIYFGIAATIIAAVAIRSMPQMLEAPGTSKAVTVEPFVVAELEPKPVEADPMPASIMAAPANEPVAENQISEQKPEPERTQLATSQITTSQTAPEHVELEAVAVKDRSHSHPSENNSAKIEKATAEEQQSTGKVIPTEAIKPPAVLAVTEPSLLKQEQIATKSFFTVQPYRLLAGNSLWQLSEHFYNEPLYWPHIFYSNSGTIFNPDKLPQGHTISIPTLEGQPGNLTAHDRKSIAEGYFLVYTFYKKGGHPDAIFALLEAKRYSAEVVKRNHHNLTLSAVEHIMLNHQEESSDL